MSTDFGRIMMPRLLQKPDSATALRLRRQRMAVYSYGLAWLGITTGIEIGAFEPLTPHWEILTGLLSYNVLIYIAVRSGFSQKFSDPSLTAAQMIAGIIAVTAILHYANEIRGAMLSIYFMVMIFGVFALSRRGMVLMSAIILSAYSGLLVWEWSTAPEQQIFAIIFGHWVILALGLFWFIYVGGYIHNLQQRAREQRETLRGNQKHLTDTNDQLRIAMDQLAKIAVRDELTGLFNRRHFLERLDEELAKSERSNQSLHVALIDLDHFKKVNDEHGHQVGDLVLRKFAEVARRELRRSDVLARYGGEEFIILFSEGETADIQQVLERLRIEFARACVEEVNAALSTTLSAGLAQWKQNDRPETITLRADKALYRAKNLGRNQLAVA